MADPPKPTPLSTALSTPHAKAWTGWDSSPATPESSSSTIPSLQDTPITPPEAYRSQSVGLDDTPTSHSGFSPTIPPQHTFSKLNLGQRIAHGQWSNVHLSKINTLDAHNNTRLVVVKVPASKMSVEVHRHEASILAYLGGLDRSSEYVVEFLGFESETNSIVLEYVPLNLDQLARTGDLSRDIIQSLTRQLVNGLAFVHGANVVHGDIKPSNILIRSSGLADSLQAVYCDFSASTLITLDVQPCESAGTYDYMAPELFSITSRPTARSDVYALGMTLLHACIGRSVLSYSANLFALRARAMQGRPFEVVSDIGDMPKLESLKIRPWIEDALKRAPETRPSAKQWAQNLLCHDTSTCESY